MDDDATIPTRVSPTVKTVSLAFLAARAAVLLTSRKLGTVPCAPRPSWGRVHRECLGRGSYLIYQASPVPICFSELST